MKNFSYIWFVILLLQSCSLFATTPDSVVQGQRAIYQGVVLAEENDMELLQRYRDDNQAAVTYHINFVFEPKIDAIRRDPDLSKEEKSIKIAELEKQRDLQLQNAYAAIERNAQKMQEKIMQNHMITKKLIESVYQYLSTSPISIDNIPFWIEKLKKVAEIPNGSRSN